MYENKSQKINFSVNAIFTRFLCKVNLLKYIFSLKQKEAELVIGRIEIIDKRFLTFPYSDDVSYYTNSEGSLVMMLYIQLKNVPSHYCASNKKEFKRVFSDELVKNMTALLEDNSFGDVKILTKDNKEVLAHKAILAGNNG